MKKLLNLALTAGAVAGAAYYLQCKGILSVASTQKEDGGREIDVKVNIPKPAVDAAEEAADTAEEIADAAEDLAQSMGNSAAEAMDELSRDIDSMLESIRENPDGQF